MTFKRGDRVLVPWGLDDLVGEVEDVFGPLASPFARVRVEIPDSAETVEMPIKMSELRAAPANAVTVSSLAVVDGQLVAQVDVQDGGDAELRHAYVTAGADESRLLERLLGPERALAVLADFATRVVKSMIDRDGKLWNYQLSGADAHYLVAKEVGDSAS